MTRVLPALLLAACSLGASSASSDATVSVYAASSLTDVMAQAESTFEAAHEGIDVQVSLAGSQVLRLQIEQGAPARIFVSADRDHLQALARQGLVQPHGDLAANRIVLIVPESSPLTSFRELPQARRLVVGASTVPIGRYTQVILERAEAAWGPEFSQAVEQRIVSRESNVRLVRAKVALGEADAALVYRTDAVGLDGVRVIELPEPVAVRATYPIGRVLQPGAESPASQAFLDFLAGPEGRAILQQHGFEAP